MWEQPPILISPSSLTLLRVFTLLAPLPSLALTRPVSTQRRDLIFLPPPHPPEITDTMTLQTAIQPVVRDL